MLFGYEIHPIILTRPLLLLSLGSRLLLILFLLV
jgi:hypothetical protein